MTAPVSPSAPVQTADASACPGAVVAVYVMADRPKGDVRVGLTTDLGRHAREYQRPGRRKLGVSDDRRLLVWFERHDRLATAVAREQAIQGWRPEWVVDLVEAGNPQWLDLAANWFDPSDDGALLI